jgi:hypothetical protein
LSSFCIRPFPGLNLPEGSEVDMKEQILQQLVSCLNISWSRYHGINTRMSTIFKSVHRSQVPARFSHQFHIKFGHSTFIACKLAALQLKFLKYFFSIFVVSRPNFLYQILAVKPYRVLGAEDPFYAEACDNTNNFSSLSSPSSFPSLLSYKVSLGP